MGVALFDRKQPVAIAGFIPSRLRLANLPVFCFPLCIGFLYFKPDYGFN